MGTRFLGVKNAICESEGGEASISRSDLTEEVVGLVGGVEEGCQGYVREVGGVTGGGRSRGCDEVEGLGCVD